MADPGDFFNALSQFVGVARRHVFYNEHGGCRGVKGIFQQFFSLGGVHIRREIGQNVVVDLGCRYTDDVRDEQ
ncbi:hypothetical protein SDC9_116208 [bioreactor metagenome]|uniref:Uncharacterized protein n=1 Tax=bioreactor metagenome TaxID=1076179 RepID=A0A645C5N7_9ZZZZ